jgi:16S rRNA (guanine527-N7)-methyltransferase
MNIRDYFNYSNSQIELIEKFYDIHVNATLNVTRIKDREDFYKKHVLDSFLVYTEKRAKLGKNVVDIGTGGGFPGIILAIMYPEKNFTLVDSVAKKCKFLEDAVKELGIKNVEVITSRAENIKDRKFQTILSRGVAKVEQLIKFTYNLADRKTTWVLYKGENVEQELLDAKNIMKKRKLKYENIRYDEPIQRTYTVLSSIADS